MPTLRHKEQRNKAWMAKVRHDYQFHFLGYFSTYEEALAVEREFLVSIGRDPDNRQSLPHRPKNGA